MRILLFGDSITEGIGSKKYNYDKLLSEENKQYKVVNKAKTGSTIDNVYLQAKSVAIEKSDVVVIWCGNVDAMVRPNVSKNSFNLWSIVPARYKIGGMLDPRPFYSKKWYRWFPDRIDNLFRKVLRKILFITQGKCQWVEIEEFIIKYLELIEYVKGYTSNIILVSNIYIDEKIYLDSLSEFEKYNKRIERLSKEAGVNYLDCFNVFCELLEKDTWLTYYCNDHFHPNQSGYNIIGDLISKDVQLLEQEENSCQD